jgi:hypothetical protein
VKKLWNRHKQFGIPLSAGLAALALWSGLVWSPLKSSTVELTSRHAGLLGEAETLAAGGVAGPEALAEAQADLERRRADLAALAGRAGFRLPDWALQAVERGRAAFEFETRAPTEAEQFQSRGMKFRGGASQPLGFAIERPAEPVAREQLVRLTAVIRIVQSLQESGVTDVVRIEPFLDRPARDEPAFRPELFVNGVRIGVTFEAPSKAVFAALHRLEAPGEGESYLPLLRFETTQKQAGRDWLEARLEAAVLEVQPDGALSLAPPEEQP